MGDKDRWRDILTAYQIDGKRVFDTGTAQGRADLDGVIALCDNERDPPRDDDSGFRWWIVNRQRMEKLWGTASPITDDNLGHEYQ